MTKVILILIGSAVLIFAAGGALGLFVSHNPPAAPQKPERPERPRHGLLEHELHLTPEQTKQMQDIWASYGRGMWQQGTRRGQLAKDRNQAVVDLLTPEQKTQYDQIQKNYADRLAQLGAERHKAFEEAVAKTKALLTPEQAEKYEKMMKDSRWRGGPGGPGSRRHRGGPSSRPRTNSKDDPPTPPGGE